MGANMQWWMILGAIAVPTVLAFLWCRDVNNALTAHIARGLIEESGSRSGGDARVMAEVEKLRATVQAQEKLIAVLWAATVGLEDRSDPKGEHPWSWSNTPPL